jgi:biopolymer transport protein ExbD|tara:strand:+ start:660 stop:1100 length:441 start_codon:yes stop_codon:yes gene_type:complete
MTKISLTPIIDVVFILLIFFMLATNFQDFSKTDIKLSQDKAKATLSDERVFIIEFNAKEEFKLNNQSLPLDKIKLKIKSSEQDDENILVVAKPSDGVNVQLILTVIEDLKKSKIENVMLGVTSDNAKDSYQFKRKESQKLPMLEKL